MNKGIALLALTVAALSPGLAEACRCVAPEAPTMESVRTRLCEADVVFMGKVTDERVVDHGEVYPGKETIFTLEPEAIYRGEDVENYSARFVSTASCDYRFQSGESYLVFANEGNDPNEIRVSICGDTAPTSEAEAKTGFIDEMLAAGADPCVDPQAELLEKDAPPTPASAETSGDALVTTSAEVQQPELETESDGSTGYRALLNFMSISVPGYFVLQIFMLMRCSDRWRRLAMLPLIPMVPLIGYTLFSYLSGSGMWPFALVLLTPFVFAYLVILLVLWIRSGHHT